MVASQRTHVLAGVVVATLTLQMYESRDAHACSPLPLVVVDEGQQISGVPTRGVVPIFARVQPGGSGDAESLVTIVVRDPEANEVAGTVSLANDRLMWTASSPLQPQTRYDMDLELPRDQWSSYSRELSFVTAADDTVPSLNPTITTTLYHEYEPVEQVCCDPSQSTCEDEGYHFSGCWVQTANIVNRMSVEIAPAENVGRFYNFSSPVAWVDRFGRGPARFRTTFESRNPEYCIDVSVHSILDDRTSESRFCLPDQALIELPPFVAEVPDTSFCLDPTLVDPVSLDPVELSDSGSCSVGGKQRSGWIFVLALLMLARRRRTHGG